MAELIIGLHLDYPAAELKTLLGQRLEYHKAKVAAYKEQEVRLEKIEAELGEEAKRMGKTSNRSPLENIEEAIKRHENQCVFYTAAESHLAAGAIYRLSEDDLVRLGISGHSRY